MKRLSSSGSLAALISMPSSKEERDQKTNPGYSREFQAMLDSLEEEDYADQEASHIPHEKKRRLTLDQVKSLEKNFEVENKLEPERKMKLAGELGLQPRQVAIWFQNRRARWKTKQLERDYGTLKANYETLKLDYKELEEQHVALSQELKELKAKLGGEANADSSSQSGKEEYHASESENNASAHSQNQEFISDNNNIVTTTNGGVIKGHSCSNVSSAHAFMNWIQFSDARTIMGSSAYQVCPPHLVKIEEQTLFGTEDSCNFLSVDQPPALYWHFTEQ